MSKELCLRKICETEAYARGLCQPCYQTAHRIIKSGKVTEEQLISSNKMLAKHITATRSEAVEWFLNVE